MKNTIEKTLSPLDGYLVSIKRNVETSMYELEVGFRKNWVYKSTDDVECKVNLETDNGSLVTISPKHEEVTIDILIEYVKRVIETNKKITEMEKRFEEKLKEQRKRLEDEIYKFQDELEKFKNSSFESLLEEEKNNSNEKNIKSHQSDNKKIDNKELEQKLS